MNQIRKSWWPSLLIGTWAAVFTVLPVKAAERIDLTYGPFVFPVSVKELELFAEEGKIEPGLEFYLKRLTPAGRSQLREVLRSRYNVDHVTVSRITNTVSGKQVLRYVGEVIKSPSGGNGFYGIRAAAVLAAADSEGLSVINFLRQFPTNIKIDIRQVLKVVEEISTHVGATQQSIAKLKQISSEMAAAETPVNFQELPDPRSPGKFDSDKQTIKLIDQSRDRELIVDLYLPKGSRQSRPQMVGGAHPTNADRQDTWPVIIISNGLGGKRDRFIELARHLVSHGFAVIIPDHPDSNHRRQKAFNLGLYGESFDATAYIDRPLDITFVLDELEQDRQLASKLNWQQIGIFGYSIGGITALSLAGAEINFPLLEKECHPLKNLLNISLLYQCRALEITQRTVNLRDDRIKAAFVFVPFVSILFGQASLNRVTIPIFWEAADTDILSPLLLEQIPAFSWLNSAQKYRAVSEGLPHTRVTLNLTNRLMNRKLSASKMSAVAKVYHNALGLAFFQVHVAQNQSYRPYLQASYMQVLSEEPYYLNLVRQIEN